VVRHFYGELLMSCRMPLRLVVLTTFEVPFTATYATQFDDFSGEQFQILGERQVEHGTIVKTQLAKSDGGKVAINYTVHDNDTSWQIRDVYLADTISERDETLGFHRDAAKRRHRGLDFAAEQDGR
jgi:hypothetical protein